MYVYVQSELQEENSQLVEKLEDIVRTNKDLREANLLLQERCESLLEDLSIKEAQWSEREERLTAEVPPRLQNIDQMGTVLILLSYVSIASNIAF